MTRLGKFEKAVEIVKEEIQDQGNVNTAVVGGMGTGIDFSVIIPNILLEEEKNLVVIDPVGEISNMYSFKEKQGYQILKYNLEKENVLQQLQMDLANQKDEKVLIHVIFPDGHTEDDRQANGKLVFQFLKIVKEQQDVKWKKEKSLHIFLKGYEGYAFPEFAGIIEVWRGYNVSITFSVYDISGLEESILNNCHYILYKRILNPQTADRIVEECKYYHVEFDSMLLGRDVLFEPLTREMLMQLPLDMGVLYLKHRGREVKIVQTYNVDSILEKSLYGQR